MDNKTLIICPVYNEESTLNEFYKTLRISYSGDVLFVDDGSTDRGADILKGIEGGKTFTTRHQKRRGYGAALLSGFDFSLNKGYKRIVTIDVDMQHNPEKIPLFLDGLDESDVIIGSRYLFDHKGLNVPGDRLTINRYITGLINLVFSTNFTDPFCGFRGYRDTFLQGATLKETGYALGLEILLEIIRTGTGFKDIQIEMIYNNHLRQFLDGLDDPKKRLLYYLDLINRKKREIFY